MRFSSISVLALALCFGLPCGECVCQTSGNALVPCIEDPTDGSLQFNQFKSVVSADSVSTTQTASVDTASSIITGTGTIPTQIYSNSTVIQSQTGTRTATTPTNTPTNFPGAANSMDISLKIGSAALAGVVGVLVLV